MLLFFLLSLSTSSLFGHPASSIDKSEPSCNTFKSFEQSLEIASNSCSLCLDSETKSENFSFIITLALEVIILVFVSAGCATVSLELLKTCLDGITVDPECYKELHKVSVINRTS